MHFTLFIKERNDYNKQENHEVVFAQCTLYK
jgi:hypothetical protein